MTMSYATQAHFNNYDPSSFGWSINGPLVPFTFQGVNFGQCARDVHAQFTAFLTELVPHIPSGIGFGPHDDWCYSTTDDLPDGSPSFHHFGLAFDLNWSHNPMGNYVTNPDAGQPGAIPHDIASSLARKYGMEYGGDWSGGEGHLGFKDFMHFESHLSPAVARTVPMPTTTEELTMDAEVKAAFAALNARLDALPAEVWDEKAFPVSYPDVKAASVVAGISKTVKADLAVDQAEAAQEAPKPA